MLLGTGSGTLLEMVLEERERREPLPRPLYDLGGPTHPVHGLALAALPHSRTLALVATPSRLLVFAGGPGLEQLFALYPEAPGATCARTRCCILWSGVYMFVQTLVCTTLLVLQ